MDRDPRKAQDSLAPVSLDGLSLDEEVDLLKSGRPGQLWRWFASTLVVGVVGFFTVQSMDAAQAREDARANLGRLTGTHLQSFLDCAIPDARPVSAASRERLHSLLERQLVIGQEAFSERLNTCLPDLLSFRRGLASMPVPLEVEPDHQHMTAAAYGLYDRVQELADALVAEPDMDYVRSTGLIDRVTGAHEAFIKARQAWNTEMAF